MSEPPARTEPEYWEDRLFRASFRYRGKRRFVPAWYAKIQWQGRRRTLRLRARGRFDAAREVAGLYRELLDGGWEAVDYALRAREPALPAGPVSAPSVVGTGRVSSRKYVNNLNPGFERELFAELVHEGVTGHVPLGTEDLAVAQWRAGELQAELRRDGWPKFRLSHARETTVSVFWQANPMTCTYTTFLTFPARFGGGAGAAARVERTGSGRDGRGWRILIIEPDGSVRRALAHWLAPVAGVARLDACPLASEVPQEGAWDLILANREQPAAALRERFAAAAERAVPVLLTHGVFADSDAIFASFSGVSQGYLLRRLPPAELLAPLLHSFPEALPRSATELDRQVRRYFQAIFDVGHAAAAVQPPDISAREQEVLDLLSRGFSDKQIAQELRLSVWTIHSHLKRIFSKYGVRTRTEAVVRYLQK